MRDYGSVTDVYGRLREDAPNYQEIKHTQVYTATHKGEGANSRLPFMERSFISFTFGGKSIEDFNLIATISGDRMERSGYSTFEDLTSEYEVLDGQFYWGTHYTNHELTFDLATDAMTQNELDRFLHWFQPGKTRELILSEHPNRAIEARVSAAPELHLLPFEEKVTKKIGDQEYKTSTTLYKGEITLTFVMEEPYWYSKINIFGYYNKDTGVFHDVWTDANGKEVSIFNDPDAIKIALEDNIPIASMIDASMLLGDNTFADADTSKDAMTADIEIDENIKYIELTDENNEKYYELDYESMGGTQEAIDALIPPNSRIAITKFDGGEEIWLYGARLSGAVMSESSGIENFAENESQYFYYAGNAPSHPIIEFTLTPTFDENGYINSPKNSYVEGTPYNTITFESLTKKELQFTTPSAYTGYNQAIKIFQDAAPTAAWVDVRKLIRDYVNHPAARAWANKVIDSFEELTVSHLNGYAVNRMKYFLLNEKGLPLSATFEIDSKTGRAIGKIQYRVADETEITDWATYAVLKDENEGVADPYYQMAHEEDVGDMIRSNYLIIEDQNQPTADGHIVAWSGENEENRLHAHVIRHDVVNGLHNVFIKYNNMYL